MAALTIAPRPTVQPPMPGVILGSRSGALLIFPGNKGSTFQPGLFRRPPSYFRGLGQDEDYYYENGWGDGYGDYYVGDDGGYSDFDVWLYEQGYESADQFYADEAAGQPSDYDLWLSEQGYSSAEQYAADQAAAQPSDYDLWLSEQGFSSAEEYQAYNDYAVWLYEQGFSDAEINGILAGEITLDEAFAMQQPGYSQGLELTPTQRAAVDQKVQEAATKKAQPAAGGSSGGGSAGGGTPAQKAAQAQQAAAKTPAEIAAAQKALAEANAAAGNWTEKDSLIPGVKNLWVLAGGGVAAFLLLKGGNGVGGSPVSYTTISAPRAPRKTNPHRRAHRRRR